MNQLRITGVMDCDAHYLDKDQERSIRFTIKHTSKGADYPIYTYFACEYKEPPDTFWKDPRLREGTLLYIEGPVYLLSFKKGGKTPSKTIAVKIKLLEVKETTQEYLNKTRNEHRTSFRK